MSSFNKMDYMSACPCKDCTDRYPACHDNCEQYKTWRDDYRKKQSIKRDWQCERSARIRRYSNYKRGVRK